MQDLKGVETLYILSVISVSSGSLHEFVSRNESERRIGVRVVLRRKEVAAELLVLLAHRVLLALAGGAGVRYPGLLVVLEEGDGRRQKLCERVHLSFHGLSELFVFLLVSDEQLLDLGVAGFGLLQQLLLRFG